MNNSQIYAAITEKIIANFETAGSWMKLWQVPSPVSMNGHSNKVWVVVTGPLELQGSNFSVFPIPNNSRFSLSVTSPVEDTFTISVYNQFGEKVFEVNDWQVIGTLEKQIDLGPVANGVYSVVLRNNGQQIVKKVVVFK